jgi:tetraacyldisaccharide 4'-kinase
VAFRDWLEQSLLTIWFGRPRGTSTLLVPWVKIGALITYLPLTLKSHQQAIRTANAAPPKVVVVGNLVVGGGGKTPMVIALAKRLTDQGFKVGLLCSGYGSSAYENACLVHETANAAEIGDEALMLALSTRLPVAAGRNRIVSKALLLKAHPELNVLVCDDGLQNRALTRDVEIVVFDERLCGNEKLLPAGPLREPLSRLASVDIVVAPKAALESKFFEQRFANKSRAKTSPAIFEHGWTLAGFIPLRQYEKRLSNQPLMSPKIFSASYTGHVLQAIAGIAHPEKFLNTLTELGLEVALHKPGDHQVLSETAMKALANLTLVMTEKDAVKYLANTTSPALANAWVAIGHNELPKQFVDKVITLIEA